MRLSVVLAGVIGVGSAALVLGLGTLYYSWESLNDHRERQRLEQDAYQQFIDRYPRHRQRLDEVVAGARKTLETALNLSLALSEEGQALSTEGSVSDGWRTVLCQSPQLAFGSLQRPGKPPHSVILTGRAAQLAQVNSQDGDQLTLTFPPQQTGWSAQRVTKQPACIQEESRNRFEKFTNLFLLNKAPAVLGTWASPQEAHWGVFSRILLDEGEAVALVDEQKKTASVLTRPQVVGAMAVTPPRIWRTPFAVTTVDHRNAFLCLATGLEEGGSLTWGVDFLTLIEDFAEAPNRALFVVTEGALIPVRVAPYLESIRTQLASAFGQPSYLIESFGRMQLADHELLFQQFIPVAESDLRVLLVEAPKAPGTPLEILLQEKARSKRALFVLAAWIGLLTTLGLIALAWITGRSLAGPIRRASFEINHLLVGGEVGPRPRFTSSAIEEVRTLDQACVDLYQRMVERNKLQKLLNAFVAAPIAKRLEEGVVHPGGGRFRCAILFADIRGFTAQSAKMRADEVIILLNSVFEVICPCIEEEGGVIDKFVGDEVMAIFGAPQTLPNPQRAALDAAIRMRDALHQFNEGRRARGLTAVEIGWGIASGEVTAGIVGSATRSNFTALGTPVNLASRLCDAAEPYEILVDQATFQVADRSDMRHKAVKLVLQGLGEQSTVRLTDVL